MNDSKQARPARADEAIARWRELLGAANVDGPEVAQQRYGACTTGFSRRIAGALRPASRDRIVELLAVARECARPLYPISTGRNWGYGTALPVVDDCTIVDLSNLTAIRTIDADLGLFEVEPGVTQAALHDYLQASKLRFMVPTTGAGPDASLLGNALERGYGITPTADHFAAVTRIEAVLPDGRVYRPALSQLGAELADHAFKWGLGPYLDGLFTQSGFGIVTSMTLALARRPELVEAFYFAVPDAGAFEDVAMAVRGSLQELGSVAGSVNLMNRHRVLAMTAPYDAARTGDDGLLTDAAVADMGRRYRVDPWMGMGALYGPREIVAAARKLVRQRLSGSTRRLVFMTMRRARLLEGASRRVLGRSHGIPSLLGRIRSSLEILEGRPDRVAHGLLYWQRGGADLEKTPDPAQAACGLIWYAPLVPLKPDLMARYVRTCTEVLRAHSMEPLITLSTLTDRCLDSSVPLLFDPTVPGEADRAHRCYAALVAAGRDLGCMPYRLHVGAMAEFTGSGGTFWDLAAQLGETTDPGRILSPGRYAPLPGR
ncbi:MAG TPA: FAD-binding oxidoreductase [Burkholderiaceae bacterium]|nr:FAD-binding oxidoreductase [Burkholderiaceae bacterium]